MTVLSIAPKPTPDEQIKESVMKVLKEALAEAEKGEISDIVIIAVHPDGAWSDWQSSTNHASAMVGRLDIAKHKRILNILQDD